MRTILVIALKIQAPELFVIQVGCRHNERTHTGIQNGFNLELVFANVLVLCEEHPLPLTEDGEEFDVKPAGDFVEWPRLVPGRLQLQAMSRPRHSST
jgi:hypothetical protein